MKRDLDENIKKFIRKLHRWVCWRNLAHRLLILLVFGAAAAAVLELIACFTPCYRVHLWAAAVLCAAATAAFVWSFLTRPTERKAALLLDATGLKERTVTALELLDDESPFAGMQKRDAWEHVADLRLRKVLPVKLSKKRIALLAAAVFAGFAAVMAPSSAKEEAADRRMAAMTVKEETQKLEELSEELKKEDLSEAELASYQEILEQIRQELGEVTTQEELDKALERSAYKLSEASEDTENKNVQDRMQELASAMGAQQRENADGSQQNEQLEKLAKEAESFLEELERSGKESALSQDDLEQLADQLKELAALSQDENLSAQLSEAASQAASGSISMSQLATAKAAVSELGSQAQAALAKANDSTDQNGQQSSDTGQSQNASANGSGQGSGDGDGNGNGTGNGSGNGSGNGNGSGSGNNNGSGNGTGGGWNYGGKTGSEGEIDLSKESLAVPNNTGEDGNLTGTAGEGASYTTKGGASVTWSGNSTSLDSVIASYSRQAMSKIEGSDYPSGLQDIVKSYFEQLNQ